MSANWNLVEIVDPKYENEQKIYDVMRDTRKWKCSRWLWHQRACCRGTAGQPQLCRTHQMLYIQIARLPDCKVGMCPSLGITQFRPRDASGMPMQRALVARSTSPCSPPLSASSCLLPHIACHQHNAIRLLTGSATGARRHSGVTHDVHDSSQFGFLFGTIPLPGMHLLCIELFRTLSYVRLFYFYSRISPRV